LFSGLLPGKAVVEVPVVSGEVGDASEGVVIGRVEKRAEEKEERKRISVHVLIMVVKNDI
jgi:20S proteasome alpha/beta subunit